MRNDTRDQKQKYRSSGKRKGGRENKGFLHAAVGVVLVVFALYVVFTLVNQQMKIAEKKAQLEAIQNEIVIQEVKNDEMRQVNEFDDSENDAYIERVAREEFDYSKKGERVFINVAGE